MIVNLVSITIELFVIAKELRSYQQFKHVLRHNHLIRKTISRNDVKFERFLTDDNIANLFAEPLT